LDSDVTDRSFAELAQGLSAEQAYTMSEAVQDGFIALSDDRNPLHVDEVQARAAGFEGKVMHGGILHAFLSHFVGMVLPGRRSLLLSADIRYLAPSYLGDVIVIHGVIEQWVESQQVVVLGVRLENRTRGRLAARARIQVLVRGD
jgi:acyl dehydratase